MKIPLTQIRFLYRARDQFGKKVGVVEGERSWTYEEYFQRCSRLANLLLSWKLDPSSRVAFLCYNTHPLLEAYYGVVLARCIFLPLNIRLSASDFLFILNDCEAQCLFFHPDFAAVVEEIKPGLKTVKRFVQLDSTYDQLLDQRPDQIDFDCSQVDEDSVAELFYTSGTTDQAKGVMLTHRNLFLHALEAAIAVGIQESDVQLHTIPLFHVNGWGTPQYVTCVGGRHVLLQRFDPQQVFEQIQRHKVTRFSLVPTMTIALVNHPDRPKYDFSSVRKVMVGGAAAHPDLIRQVEQAFECECLAGYGLTETSPILTLASPKTYLQMDERHKIQAMTGYPLPGVELKILDENQKELPWDGKSMGEIVVRGDMVMEGYWKKPRETEEAFRGGWFHTGDMATVSPEGYVLIQDRKKDIIISGGENISSLEVEKALLAHPAVLECAVIPIPHPTWGETPRGLVVLKPDQNASDEELIEHCKKHLAGFKVPQGIDFFDSLPKGGTGKILKRELREPYWKGHAKRVH